MLFLLLSLLWLFLTRNDVVRSDGIEALLKANCETGALTVTVGGIAYNTGGNFFFSFDAGTATGEFSPYTTTGDGIGTSNNNFPTGTEAGQTSYCYTYFYGDLSAERSPLFSTEYEVTPDSGTPQLSTESDKLRRDWFAIRLQRGKMESFLYPLYWARRRPRAHQ